MQDTWPFSWENLQKLQTLVSLEKKNSVSLFHKDNTHFKWQKIQRKLTYIKFTWVISEAMNFCPLSEAWLAVKIEVIRIKVMFSECFAQKWIVYGEYN